MKMKLSLLAASAILAVGMTGCWTENAPTPVEAAVVAKALDGYIAGATVCVDTDNNEATCEYTTTTDSTGNYTIPGAYNKGKALITGGIDLDTGKAFAGILKAPAGSTMATPLTTLLADGMSAAQITTMLGLPAGTDLSVDYRKAGSFNAAVTKAAMIAEAVIGQLTAIFSADATLSKADIMKAIVTAMKTDNLTLADLSNTAKLTTLIQSVDTSLSSSVDTANVSTIANNLNATITALPATITEANVVSEAIKVAEATTNNVANVDLSKSVTIANNTFSVGSNSVTFDQNGTFTAPVTASASNTTIGFTLNDHNELTGSKIIDVAIKINGIGSDKRELKAVLKNVTITSAGITVPQNDILYVEGKDSSGIAVTAIELTDNAQDFKTVNGVTSFNLTNIMSRIEAKVLSSSGFANITKEGTYTISFYIDGVTLGFDGGTISAPVKAISAPIEVLDVTTPSGTHTVTGSKFTGTLTVIQ